ncbi:F-box/kelch-repeat protein family [Quillaja saponaria]|uniref:F-box/kelch-repeat protein family n=1 Tax=Quillaja saponaria TaxID=32244 RepID=A0AAD7PJX2_QUISA|nr:F-box/kelch-repeat protein family [Quillaja saponaria]
MIYDLCNYSIEKMPGFVTGKKRITEPNTCFPNSAKHEGLNRSKRKHHLTSPAQGNYDSPILPGLPDDVAKYCLALVPRSNFPAMGGVCKRWRSFIQSKELITVRKIAGLLEEWLYVLTMDSEGKESHWEVVDYLGYKHRYLPLMPGPEKAGFVVVVLNGKLLVMGGYSVVDGTGSPLADIYQYDSCLNGWSRLANMNVARYDFACAEVNGMVYAVGGCGMDGDNLSSAEVYDPDTDKWTLIESLRRPRWGCFACGFEGKLYVMGGRSSFTIGNSKFVDVYNPEKHTWSQIKNGCVMVTAHAVIGNKLFCMEWKNQRKLSIFNPEDNSWKMVPVPLTGSSNIGFRFGILDEKLLLFSLQEEPGYRTLLYDPNATPGSEWQTSEIKPSGLCLCSVTVKA